MANKGRNAALLGNKLSSGLALPFLSLFPSLLFVRKKTATSRCCAHGPSSLQNTLLRRPFRTTSCMYVYLIVFFERMPKGVLYLRAGKGLPFLLQILSRPCFLCLTFIHVQLRTARIHMYYNDVPSVGLVVLHSYSPKRLGILLSRQRSALPHARAGPSRCTRLSWKSTGESWLTWKCTWNSTSSTRRVRALRCHGSLVILVETWGCRLHERTFANEIRMVKGTPNIPHKRGQET